MDMQAKRVKNKSCPFFPSMLPLSSRNCRSFSGQGEVDVIPSGADKVFSSHGVGAGRRFAPEPGIVLSRALGFLAPIFVLQFKRDRPKESRPLFPHITRQEEGPNILADAVV